MLVPSGVFQEAYCKELVARTVKEFGKIDILVNNATFQASHGWIEEIGAEEWDHAFRTKFYADFYPAVVRQMQPGSIIATSSVNAKTLPPELLAYATSKGAIANDWVWSTRPCVMNFILCELILAIRLAEQELRARPPLSQGTIMGDHVGQGSHLREEGEKIEAFEQRLLKAQSKPARLRLDLPVPESGH